MALVSGRTIADLDRLFGDPTLLVAGTAWLRAPRCEWRAARGARGARATRRRCAPGCSAWSRAIPDCCSKTRARDWRCISCKARELEHELRAEVALLAAPLVPQFALLDGHAVIEVKPAAHTKDSAVSAYMEEAPFRGRLPIFIGDDQTDYGGFAAVRRFDGLAIAVGLARQVGMVAAGARRRAAVARATRDTR